MSNFRDELDALLAPEPLPSSISGVPPKAPSPPPTDNSPSKPPHKPKKASSKGEDLSVFDILNTFCWRWFLSRNHLMTNIVSAQKDEGRKFSWVEFTPQHYSYLVKCAIALVPHPIDKVKKVIFAYILELLDGEGDKAFFNLHMGGHKASRAQKEKRRLAQKRSCVAKRERERATAKADKPLPHVRKCPTCGVKFKLWDAAKKHKCYKSKEKSRKRKAAGKLELCPKPPARSDKWTAVLTQPAPSAPSNNEIMPTGSEDPGPAPRPVRRSWRQGAQAARQHLQAICTAELSETDSLEIIDMTTYTRC